MKRTKTFFYSTIIFSFFLTVGQEGYGQGEVLQKTYSWNADVNNDVNFTFSNYDCDLVIHTWDRPAIEYKMTVDATLKSKEDAARLDAYIEGLELTHSAGNAEFVNRFWQSRKTMMGRKTMSLKGERDIRYSKFNMKGELWIPATANLNLESKYSGIELEDLLGRLDLNLYNDKLFGGDVSGNVSISAKYSSLELDELKDVKADLYSVNLEAENIGNLNASSKYSKFRVDNAGKIEINAYNDKYVFRNTGDIKFVDKYSDLTAQICGYIDMECYNSTITLTSIEDLKLKSKYTQFEIDGARNVHISESYNDNFKISSLATLNITASKYGTYKIDHLSSSFIMTEGYSDKCIILKTGSEFKGMKVNGKYNNIEMGLPADLDYRFKANLQYPDLDINEEAMNVRIKIQQSSNLEMDALKGTEKEGMPEFEINGYNMSLTFTEIH